MKYLVETALLGHGLYSIEDDQILSIWPKDASLVWIEKGKMKIGSISEFIPARENSSTWERLDGRAIRKKDYKEKNAFLTASGAIAVAKEIQCSIVVSAGIGGIRDLKSEALSYDLLALAQMGITLVATSPKDMLDIETTLKWLEENKVKTYGINTEICNGYLFKHQPIKLFRKLSLDDLKSISYDDQLILNPIPEEKRIQDLKVLELGISAGKEAKSKGQHFHPAVNAYFDKATKGLSSILQLEALIANIAIAKQME